MSIQISHLAFSYGPKEIFSDLNLSLPDNGFIIILGKSGSGKTTFLSLLSHTLKPTKGEITGMEKTPAIVFQSPLLLSYLTVKENVGLPFLLEKQSLTQHQHEIDSVLHLLDIEALKDRYPDSLSGGEQTRVSIARALVKGSQTLILDEPTGQLDETNSRIIYQTLKKLSQDHLILLVTHDEKNALDLADELYLLKEKRLIRIQSRYIKESRPSKSSFLSDKSKTMSFKNSLFLTDKFLTHKKFRVLLSLIFLSFNLLLIYLGLNLNSNMSNSVDSLLNGYYASDVVSLSKYQEIASSGSLHLSQESFPDQEVLTLLNIPKTYYDLSYFFPSYNDVSLKGKNCSALFSPVIQEQPKKLKTGHAISSVEEVIINESLLDELDLTIDQALGSTFTIVHQTIINSKSLESSDLISLMLNCKVVGVSNEKKGFNSATIYYSYHYFLNYLSTISLKNISLELDDNTTVLDLLLDSDYDGDDFKSTSLLFLSDNPSEVKAKGEKYFPGKLKFSSTTLSVKESTQEILDSLLKILLFFSLINTLSALMLEFLSIYSLYLDNMPFFALVKVFQQNKKSVLMSALGMQTTFFLASMAITLALCLFFTLLINQITNLFGYPSFLTLFDFNCFSVIFLLSFLCSLLSAFLPLVKIRDKDVKKELEDED